MVPGFSHYEKLLETLGKHKVGEACLYINKLDDVDLTVLRKLIKSSVKDMQKRHDCTRPDEH